MRIFKLSRTFPWFAECSQNLPVQVEFQYAVGAPVYHVNDLVRSRGYEKPPRGADLIPFANEVAIAVENLNPVVLSVPNIQEPLRVNDNRVRNIKFTGTRTLLSPVLHEFAILVVLNDPRVPVSVSNKNIPGRSESYIGGFIEESFAMT